VKDSSKLVRPKAPFFDVLNKPGGVSLSTALNRAENALEKHRGDADNALNATIQKIEILARAREVERGQEFYDLSLFILDIAGLFQPPLCRAANSLCELVYRMRAAKTWDWSAVDVHVGALRLLNGRRSDKDADVISVLSGLGSVVAKFPDPTPA